MRLEVAYYGCKPSEAPSLGWPKPFPFTLKSASPKLGFRYTPSPSLVTFPALTQKYPRATSVYLGRSFSDDYALDSCSSKYELFPFGCCTNRPTATCGRSIPAGGYGFSRRALSGSPQPLPVPGRFPADLTDDLSHHHPYFPTQHQFAVFGNPHQMYLHLEYRVGSIPILHASSLRLRTTMLKPLPSGEGLILPKADIIPLAYQISSQL